jgi:L-fuculose-phosphate aldolase
MMEPSMPSHANHAELKFKIAAARRILFNEGCDSQAAGHVSARVPGEDAFFVTGFEYFDETVPSGVLKVSQDPEVLRRDPSAKAASPAVAFHGAIYRTRPDVNAIVHHHGRYTAVVSSTGRTIGMYNVLSYMFHDDQALIEDIPGSRVSDDERIPVELADKSVLLMHNHGCIVVGDSLETTAMKAVFTEKAARFHYECVLAGGRELTDPESLAIYKQNAAKFIVQPTWEAQLRRLPKSDPDLFQAAAMSELEATVGSSA